MKLSIVALTSLFILFSSYCYEGISQTSTNTDSKVVSNSLSIVQSNFLDTLVSTIIGLKLSNQDTVLNVPMIQFIHDTVANKVIVGIHTISTKYGLYKTVFVFSINSGIGNAVNEYCSEPNCPDGDCLPPEVTWSSASSMTVKCFKCKSDITLACDPNSVNSDGVRDWIINFSGAGYAYRQSSNLFIPAAVQVATTI